MTIGDPRAAARPAVWQTYLAPGQVFRDNGQDPGDWNSPVVPFTSTPDPDEPGRRLPVLGGFEEKSIYFLTQNPDIGLTLFDLATTPNPVVDQHGNYVLLEVRLNQSEFEYFKRTRYYDACGSAKTRRGAAATFEYLPDTGAPALPDWARQGAVEIKASWRILDQATDIPGRYFTTRASYRKPNGEVSPPLTLGLVGMHILRNTPRSKSTWAWTTFEHVDNVRILDRPVPTRPDGQPLSPSFNPGPAGAEPAYAFGFDTTGRFDYSLLSNPAAHYNPVTESGDAQQGRCDSSQSSGSAGQPLARRPDARRGEDDQRRVPVEAAGNRLAVLRDDRRDVPDGHRHQRGQESRTTRRGIRSC